MLRKIIEIDRDKCNGCGLCAQACHEGAIDMVDGKAHLARESFCDGLGDCLPACPTGAITFVEREAPAYDEAAVLASQRAAAGGAATAGGAAGGAAGAAGGSAHTAGCPGAAARSLRQAGAAGETGAAGASGAAAGGAGVATELVGGERPSQLAQWPCQIKLVSPTAPYFAGAHLLVAADCTAFAYASFHERFMTGRVTIIGCPKLDGVDYTGKLTDILSANDIQSVAMLRMEVPCCGGLERAVRDALAASGRDIPLEVITVSIDGHVIS